MTVVIEVVHEDLPKAVKLGNVATSPVCHAPHNTLYTNTGKQNKHHKMSVNTFRLAVGRFLGYHSSEL